VHDPTNAVRPSGARIARPAIACLLLVAGCAAPAGFGAPPPGRHPATSPRSAVRDSAPVVLEVRLRRSAELTDARGALRVFDQDLRVEYRAGGRGAGLDAGDVSLDGRPLRRLENGRDGVSYRLGRDEPERGGEAGGGPWATLASSGGPGVAAAAVRVKLAPYPVITRPAPGQGVLRSEELQVVMLPPVADVWYRVSIAGGGDPVSAIDLGEGRWLFPGGSLAGLSPGRARLLIEAETSCGDCPGAGLMRANWSARAELELSVTLL